MGSLHSAFPTAFRTSFSSILPHTPAILAFLPFFKDIKRYSASEPLHMRPGIGLPQIFTSSPPFSLCSDVTFSGRMSLTTCYPPATPRTPYFPFLAFIFFWSTTIFQQSISFTLLFNVSAFPHKNVRSGRNFVL